MTKATSATLLPLVKSPTIKLAKIGAPKKQIKKAPMENILIIFLEYLNINVFSLFCFKVLYSLVILLIAKGIPALDIIKKKL